MNIFEVFGPPGVGKSTLCNDTWPPSIEWDERPPPSGWAAFLGVAERLAGTIRPEAGAEHWHRMFEKAVRKMGTLDRRPVRGVYAGVGLAQRGLDLAWRLEEPDRIAIYFDAMPVDAGVIALDADVLTVIARNKERAIRQPSRELSWLAQRMVRPMMTAVEVLHARGVPLLELDTREPIDANRARIHAFTGHGQGPAQPADPGADRHSGQVAPVPPSRVRH